MPSRRLVAERGEDRLTITWPVPPPWVPWAVAGWHLAVATAQTAALAAYAIMLWRTRRMFGGLGLPWNQLVWPLSAFTLLPVSIGWWAVDGVLVIRRHRRWGQVPRVLTVTSKHLSLESLAGCRMKRREWPADRVKSVTWRPVNHVFSRRTAVVRITVRFATGWPLRLTLSSGDPTCIERARRGLHELLGPPLPGSD